MSESLRYGESYELDVEASKLISNAEVPTWESEVDWEAKLESIKRLTDPGGPNYSIEEGYGELAQVDLSVSLSVAAFGHENEIKKQVVNARDYLREQGKNEHAAQLSETLISPEATTSKISCKEIKGGNGRHPGDPGGKKQGPAGKWNPGDYHDHAYFGLSDRSEEIFDFFWNGFE